MIQNMARVHHLSSEQLAAEIQEATAGLSYLHGANRNTNHVLCFSLNAPPRHGRNYRTDCV